MCIFLLVKIAIILQFLVLTILLLPNPAFAQELSLSTDLTPPESEGTFDVPRHPELKVRVHIHRQKEKLDRFANNALVCDLTDPDSSAVTGATGWHLPSNVTYRLNRSSVPSSVGSSNLPTIATNSFSPWTAASLNKISFARGADTFINRSRFDAQNIIAWGRTSSNALAITYTWYYTASGQVAEVDTIFNNRVPWSWSQTPACANTVSYDAQNILIHETGHWMGLDDHYTSNYQDNTMFGYGSKGEIKKNTLTTGDLTGVASIYP